MTQSYFLNEKMVEINLEPASLEIVKKKCSLCGNVRKFVKGTPRDKKTICGNCWDWEKEPTFLKLTPEEKTKLEKLLKECQ